MILSQNDLNVFVVDWSPIAGQSYSNAQGAVVRVGEYVAGFVRALKAQHGLNINKVKFVGHSLGAHVAGNAGKLTISFCLLRENVRNLSPRKRSVSKQK